MWNHNSTFPFPAITPATMEPNQNPLEAPPPPEAADIAIADDVPKLHAVAVLPHHLFSHDGGTDRCSERPPKPLTPRPSPWRGGSGTRNSRAGLSPVAIVTWDVFAPSLPRPSNKHATPTDASLVLSPDQVSRLGKIIDGIRPRPLSQKRAVLPRKLTKVSPPKKAAVVDAKRNG